MINHTTELTEAQELIGRLTFDVGCLKADIERLNKSDSEVLNKSNSEVLEIRLKGFEKWLEKESKNHMFNVTYADILEMFKGMVRDDFPIG